MWESLLGTGAIVGGSALGGPVGGAIAGGLVGGMKAKAKEKATRKYNAAQAELTRYSPLTGQTGQMRMNDPNMIGNMMQGAAGGAMLGKGMAGAGIGPWGQAQAGLPQGAGVSGGPSGMAQPISQMPMQQPQGFQFQPQQQNPWGQMQMQQQGLYA